MKGDAVVAAEAEFNFGTGFRFAFEFLGLLRGIDAPPAMLRGCTKFRMGVEVAVDARLMLGLEAGVF